MNKWLKDKLDDCTHDGKFHWITCWGVAHTLGMIGLLTAAWVIDREAVFYCAIAGSVVVVLHELNGPGDLLNSTDRILDWLLPVIVAVIFVLSV